MKKKIRQFNPRQPASIVRGISLLLAVAILVWHLYYAFLTPMDRVKHSNIHFGLLLVTFYLSTLDFESEATYRRRFRNLLTGGLLVVTAVSTTYVHLNYARWLNEAQALMRYTNLDLAIGLALMIVATHATWREYGRVLGLVVLGTLFYGIAGPMFPGLLWHSGISAERLIYINSVSLDGVFGFLLGISATWIIGFILFAGIVEAYGGMEYVIRIGTKVGNHMKSGIVQVAVITSMVMGSITGSSAANVATTGSFTIPLMKDNGIRGRFAGAIESIASTGGQMLPPVMGSAAFIMADILGISYFEVIRGAILPALLFYITTVAIVHLAALKNGWTTLDVDNTTDEMSELTDDDDESLVDKGNSLWDDLLEGIPYIISLAVLLYTLVILRFDPMTAAMYTILILMATVLVRDVRRTASLTEGVQDWAAETVEGLRIGAVNMAPLTAVLASLGIVIRVLTSSGFTQRFSLQIIALAGGSFIAVLLVAMVASILFGLGMPTPAAYVVVATLTAPTLIQVGVDQLTAHIFVFYYALLSTITPPVALSCAVASGISGSTFMATAKETVRLGGFSFLIPFVFVFNSNLVYWNGISTVLTFLSVSIALVALGVAIVGYDGLETLSLLGRVIYVGVAFIVLFGTSGVIQLLIAALLIGWLAVRHSLLSDMSLSRVTIK